MTAFEMEEATQTLLAGLPPGQRLKLSAFTQTFPRIAEQIRHAVDSPMLDLWGFSKNIDENNRTTIVDPRILSAIGRLAQTRIRKRHGVYHAGLLHTYGYLFSLIDTPYGRKRDRWFSDTIERGFGLPMGTIGAFPKAGTLLHNLSHVLSRIVFRDEPTAFQQSEAFAENLAVELRNVNLSTLPVRRIVEAVGNVRLFTDLVLGNPQSPILIYSIREHPTMLTRLVTCFPISHENAEELLQPGLFGDDVLIRPRYNAWLPDWGDRLQSGSRTLQTH